MAVREGLLALLGDGPRHGYQLKTAFEAATGGAWPLNVGQVYTTLDRLARDGYVDVDETDGQKRYTITAAGRDLFRYAFHRVDEAPKSPDEALAIIHARPRIVDKAPENDGTADATDAPERAAVEPAEADRDAP